MYGVGFESDADLRHWVIKQPRGQAKKGIDLFAYEFSTAKRDTVSKNTVQRS